MKTREETAASIYGDGLGFVSRGGDALRSLARHITVVVLGNESYAPGLWRVRKWPDQTLVLDSFEDYLLRPAREGLGIPDFAWLHDVLEAHPRKQEREDAFKAVISEIPDFLERAAAQKRKRMVLEVDPAGSVGGEREGAGRPVKAGGGNQVENLNLIKQPPKGGYGPEYVVARLKRDASTDPQAADLLDQIEAGTLKPYRAAVQMGWVKSADPVTAATKAIEKVPPERLPVIWQQVCRALPDDAVDRVALALEGVDNLVDDEIDAFLQGLRERGILPNANTAPSAFAQTAETGQAMPGVA